MKTGAGKKKVVLELGGNAGVIVGESANIEDAVKKCLVSGFAYSGQICIHAQRIYVHEKVFDAFAEKFVDGAKYLKYGDPVDDATEISAMIDEENAKRVEKWVDEAVKQGAKVFTSGKRDGTYFPPTVLTNTTTEMKVNCEEVFGPVVVLEKFKTVEEAVKLVNDSQFGLQCGVFTGKISEMDYCFDNIEVGGVLLNDVPSVRYDHMPYGGVKNSGLGREGVNYAILDMMEPKILVKGS